VVLLARRPRLRNRSPAAPDNSDREGPVHISIIVAAARNGTIGRNGDMPWRMPSDLKHFKALTLGKPVIMGRKTFQSIGKPLTGRDTIVVTRDATFRPQGVTSAPSLEQALEIGADMARKRQGDEIMIAGGGEIYTAALAVADRVYLTQIATELDGDAHFPPLGAEWIAVARSEMAKTSADDYPATFIVYERRLEKTAGRP
jgi:dihydrofolate reductase